jgi:hypothetical protein
MVIQSLLALVPSNMIKSKRNQVKPSPPEMPKLTHAQIYIYIYKETKNDQIDIIQSNNINLR